MGVRISIDEDAPMTGRQLATVFAVIAFAVMAFVLVGLFFQSISSDGGQGFSRAIGSIVPTLNFPH
jgi:hypothetical protein